MIGMRIGYRGHTLWGMEWEWGGCGKGVPEEPDKWDIGDHWDNGNNGYKVGLTSQRDGATHQRRNRDESIHV